MQGQAPLPSQSLPKRVAIWAGEFTLAVASVPFLITGIFRLSDAIPLWLPFVMTSVAGLIAATRIKLRPIGLGLIAGTMGWLVAMLALFLIVAQGLSF